MLNIVELILLFVVPILIISFLLIAVGAVSDHTSIHFAALVLLTILAWLAFAAIIGPALVHIQLKSSRMEKTTYKEALETSRQFWLRFVILSITVAVVIVFGLILLIVPGLIFIRRYFLAQYVLIDQDLSVTESMEASSKLTKGRSMAVFGIIGVDILIALPNVIPVIGSVITFVLQIAYLCAPAIRYQQLKALKPVKA